MTMTMTTRYDDDDDYHDDYDDEGQVNEDYRPRSIPPFLPRGTTRKYQPEQSRKPKVALV